MIHQTENMVQHCVFVALFQHFIQLMLQRKNKKTSSSQQKNNYLSAIYKYKYVFITIVSHYETKFLLKYWLQTKTKLRQLVLNKQPFLFHDFFCTEFVKR